MQVTVRLGIKSVQVVMATLYSYTSEALMLTGIHFDHKCTLKMVGPRGIVATDTMQQMSLYFLRFQYRVFLASCSTSQRVKSVLAWVRASSTNLPCGTGTQVWPSSKALGW